MANSGILVLCLFFSNLKFYHVIEYALMTCGNFQFLILTKSNNFDKQLLLDHLWSNMQDNDIQVLEKGKWHNYTNVSSMTSLSSLFMMSYNMLQSFI